MVGAVACGGGGDDDDDAVASLGTDESAEADGGSDDESGGGENPRDSQEFQDAALEYAQCMRDNGIDMPDPEFDGEGGVRIGAGSGPGGAGGPGGGPDDEEFQAADDECQPIMEEAAPDMQLDPEEQAERQDQMIEVAQCMRDRGYDMPDPEVDENGRVTVQASGGEGTAGQGPGGAPGSAEQEQFESDMSECQEEAGMEMPDGAGGSTDEVED